MKDLTGLVTVPYRAPVDRPLRILIIGAHPDDGEIKAGGVAALWADRGHCVKIVSVTDGRHGHHEQAPEQVAERRRVEAEASARVLGADGEVLANPDAELEAGVEQRKQLTRLIRDWRSDIVLTHRPNDYHVDHRTTSTLVQDASFLVTVPNFLPDSPRLAEMPVFLYFSDVFQQPRPFRPSVIVDTDSVADRKLAAFREIPSQFLEWLPWNSGFADEVPEDEEGKKEFLRSRFLVRDAAVAERFRQDLVKRYGPDRGEAVQYAEAFELGEYGSRPSAEELEKLCPF